MEPRIQYAKTKDGVSIAFYTLGEGMAYVLPPTMGWCHYQLQWEIPGERRFAERIAEKRMYVRYDGRGSGLSEGDVTELSLDSLLLDLEAVVDHLGLKSFALAGAHFTGPLAIAYAARHPERVSHLTLWFTYARTPRLSPQFKTVLSLVEKDWELFTQTFAHVAFGWEAPEDARAWAQYMREAVTKEGFLAYLQALRRVDVIDLLPHVKCATQVVERRQRAFLDMAATRELASRLSGARLVLLDKGPPSPYDDEAAFRTLDEFLGEGEEAETDAEGLSADIVHTILFTDVEGSTALTDRLGDSRARELLREHERMVREALKAHSGSEVKALGDGFMTSFSSATKALECAIAMQRAFAERNESAEEPILVRVGLNAGEPIAEDDDLYGTAVNLAARITAQGKGGEILASEAVRQIVAGKKFPFSDLGETTLRGFEDRVHIYQVSWREDA